jgi:hypothetical protein
MAQPLRVPLKVFHPFAAKKDRGQPAFPCLVSPIKRAGLCFFSAILAGCPINSAVSPAAARGFSAARRRAVCPRKPAFNPAVKLFKV